MGKKGKKKGGGDLLVQSTPLQAVVLADSFDTKFRPLTLEQPRCLLPVVNTPLLDYTIECLASSGVKEVYVYCKAHAGLIKAHLEASKWAKASSRVKVDTIINHSPVNIGEALQDMDSRDVITSDFVLVSGDVVSNLNLGPIMAAHKARREKDKGAVMTSVYKKVAPGHRTRSLDDNVVLGIDPKTSQLVYFDGGDGAGPSSSGTGPGKKVRVGLDVLNEAADLELHHDLLDTSIEICAPEVLMLFTDNFDWKDVRNDFFQGVLSSEIMGNKVFIHMVSSDYAARIQCLKTYAAVSKDIVHRWVFPLSPDTNFMNASGYRHYRHNVYRESGVTVARSAVLGWDSVIGEGTRVAEGARLHGCIVGRNCVIGPGVQLTDCYVWDSVTIEADVKAETSIFASGSVIRKGAVIGEGSIVSYGVVVGPGFVVEPFTKLTKVPPEEGLSMSDSASDVASSPLASSPLASAFLARGSPQVFSEADGGGASAVGVGGVGRRYEDDDGQTVASLVLRKAVTSALLVDDMSDSSSTASEASVEFDEEMYFLDEVKDTIMRGETEDIDVDNVALEIKSVRMANNRSLSDMCHACLLVILPLIDLDNPLASTKAVIAKWAPLLNQFADSAGEEHEVLTTLKEYCVSAEEARIVFHIILQLMYEEEIVSKVTIENWVSFIRDDQVPVELDLLDQADKFLSWLAEDGGYSDYDEYDSYE